MLVSMEPDMTTLENIYLILSLLMVIAGGANLERSFGRFIAFSFLGGLVSIFLLSGEILEFGKFLMSRMPQGPVGLQFLTVVVLVCLSLALAIGVLAGLGVLLEVAIGRARMTASRMKR